MNAEQQQTFYEQGWVVLRDIVPQSAVKSAARMLYGGLSRIWRSSLATSGRSDLSADALNAHAEATEAAKKAGTEQTILDLVATKTELIKSINAELGAPMRPLRGAQMATIFPSEPGNGINEAGYPSNEVPFLGWHGHLDGLWNGAAPVHQSTERPMNEDELAQWNRDPGRNGVSRTFKDRRSNVLNFTALLGIPLSDQMLSGSGNLGLLTGAHHHMSKFFQYQRDQGGPLGPDGPGWERIDRDAPNGCGLRHYPEQVREQFKNGAEYTKDGRMWPRPDFVKVKPGDAVLALHSVPHSSTRLEGLSPRLMIYFRLLSSSRDETTLRMNPDALCDCWLEWKEFQA